MNWRNFNDLGSNYSIANISSRFARCCARRSDSSSTQPHLKGNRRFVSWRHEKDSQRLFSFDDEKVCALTCSRRLELMSIGV